MTRFCVTCGAPLAEGSGFCTACGTASASVPASSTPSQTPVSGGKSSLGKFVLIGAGIFLLLGAIAIAALVAGGYWVKQNVERAAHDRGINLGDFASGEPGSLRGADPCSFLTTAEASRIMKMNVIRAERREEKCDYYIEPRSDEQRSTSFGDALERLKKDTPGAGESGAGKTAAQSLADAERLVKQMTGGMNDGSTPLFRVEYNEDGKAQLAGMKLAMTGMGGSPATEKLSGLGDEAILGPMASILVFVKNGVGVQIDLSQVPDGRNLGIELGKRIASRL